MSDLLLREYVSEIINEKLFFRTDFGKKKKQKKKKPGFFDRLKSTFSGFGQADKFFNEWLQDQEMYGIDVLQDKKLHDQIKSYVREKYSIASARADGNEGKIDSIMRRSISNKFRRELSTLRAKQEDLEDENI